MANDDAETKILSPTWRSDPQFRIIVGGITYTNDLAFNIQINRPENNISSCVMTVDDYKSGKYEGIFNRNTEFSIGLRYGTDTWKTIFDGNVFNLQPTISMTGELLTISAWGLEHCLLKTHADTSWGTESVRHPSLKTTQQIVQDIIDNYVKKSLNGAITGYNMGKTTVENVHPTCLINYLNSNYLDNFSLINRICDIVTAWANTQTPTKKSIHWFANPSNDLYLKQIDANASDGNWPEYWTGSSQTLTVSQDMILYDFHKTMEEYINDVVLCSAFRLPAEDLLNEDHAIIEHGGIHDWNYSHITPSQESTGPGSPTPLGPMVGSFDMKATINNSNPVNSYKAWYPGDKGATWDFTKIESALSPAYLRFYIAQNDAAVLKLANGALALVTNDPADYFLLYASIGSIINDTVGQWVLVSIPIGPHWKYFADTYLKNWTKNGNANWNNINYIEISGFCSETILNKSFWLDDIHFAGNIIRRATRTAEWNGSYGNTQKIVRNDTAISDSLIASDDSGTAARLAASELFYGYSKPVVGIIQTPLAVDMLPGQKVHIHACQQSNGDYRIDKDMRMKEVVHKINSQGGFRTELNLTDDLNFSRAIGAPTMISLIQEYMGALRQAEAKDLKGGGIDNLIPRLEHNY